MKPLQESAGAFIESACAELGCRELARPLREGLSVLCEASRRTPLTPERMAEFHGLVTDKVKPIVSRINRFLTPCGLSIVLDYSDKAREHFEYEPHHVAAILHSLQEEGSPVAPVAINEPMIARYYYGTWHEDDDILEHCLSDSLWHEAGHHIVDSAVDIELVGELPDDEDVVESFGRYMTERTLGYDGDYDIEMVNKAIGAVTLLKMYNSGTYSKAGLKKVMAFVGNEFTEQELAERLQECGVQEKTRQAPGGNALQEGMTPGNLDLVRYFRNLDIEGDMNDAPKGFRDEETFWEPRPHFDRWIVHNTQAADRIYEEGFRYGMKIGRLANSWGSYSSNPREKISGTVAFGTPLEDAKPLEDDCLWGSDWIDCGGSIVCKVSGVTAYHRDDKDEQVMFDIRSPEGCFWIRNTGFKSRYIDPFHIEHDSDDTGIPDSYEVIGKNPDRPLCTGTYDRCIRWCRDNGDAYAHMMKRWK